MVALFKYKKMEERKMTVRELMEQLAKCNQDAVVCVEAFMDPQVQEVKEYEVDGTTYVYISDDLEELEFQLGLYDEEEN